MKTHLYFVYILTNDSNKVLYTGVTNNLERRCYEHKNKLIRGFTQRYNVCKLVYFEEFDQIGNAIAREKQIKGLLRRKKIKLIQEFNFDWQDLFHNGKIIFPLDEKKTPSDIISNTHIKILHFVPLARDFVQDNNVLWCALGNEAGAFCIMQNAPASFPSQPSPALSS